MTKITYRLKAYICFQLQNVELLRPLTRLGNEMECQTFSAPNQGRRPKLYLDASSPRRSLKVPVICYMIAKTILF